MRFFFVLLTDGHRRFRQLAEHSEEVVMQLSPEGEFQYVSPRVTHTLHYSPQDLLGNRISDLVHQDDRQRVDAAITSASVMHTGDSIQYRLRRRDDSLIWVRSSSLRCLARRLLRPGLFEK